MSHDLIEIILTKPDNFLILKETLTRIGVPNKDNTKLFQTCHILFKRKKYHIVHFKEMFLLDGKPTSLTATDIARRNSIINYLLELKFFTLATGAEKVEPFLPRNSQNDDFRIISHHERKKWELVPKYTIGSSKNKQAYLTKY
jgi:Bacteriophage translational regulator